MHPVAGGTGPTLKTQNSPVTVGQWAGWAPIGAEQTANGYEVAWKHAADNTYQIWNVDSSGNFTSQVLNLTNTTIETYEPSFHQDLNGDTYIGPPPPPPLTTIESFGVTKLDQAGNIYYLDPVAGGTGPTLKTQNSPVTVGQFAGYVPLGAEQTANGYEVAWKHAADNTYDVWTIDSNGNWISDVWGLTGSSTGLTTAESVLHQDLNGNGMIGAAAPPAAGQGMANPADAAPTVVTGDHDAFVFAPYFGQLANLAPFSDLIQLSRGIFAEINALQGTAHDAASGNADAANDIQPITIAQLLAHQSDLFHLI